MKLISLNIQDNVNKERVIEFLKRENPDVFCLQELLEEDFDYFRKNLNLEGRFCVWRYIENSSVSQIIGKKEGVAIFSKNIIDSGEIFYRGKKECVTSKTFDEYLVCSEYRNNCALIWVTVNDENNLPFKFITTHFPVTKDGISTPEQLEVCNSFLESVKNLGEFVLCGDFNAPRGRETFTRISKKYKDNIPLKYKTSIDQNLHRVKGLMLMVDGLFTTPSYIASNVKLVDGVSDHMAVVAEINRNK